MSELRVASRYAKSLIDLAQERGELEVIHQDMLLIEQTCEQSRDLRLMLKNPIIKHDQKLKALASIFSSKVSALTTAFLQIISKKNRNSFLFSISKEFHSQYNELKGIEKAVVTTTQSLDPALRDEFKTMVEKISSKKVELEETINEELIGGFVLQIGDKQLDRSIKTQLQALGRAFSQK